MAGYRGEPLFAPRAIRRLVRGSGGIPRLINILAHKALMAAFGEGRRQVSPAHVRRAQLDTEGAQPFLARSAAPGSAWGLAAVSLSVLVLVGRLALAGPVAGVAAMSLVNDMLRDLEERRAAPGERLALEGLHAVDEAGSAAPRAHRAACAWARSGSSVR